MINIKKKKEKRNYYYKKKRKKNLNQLQRNRKKNKKNMKNGKTLFKLKRLAINRNKKILKYCQNLLIILK